MDAGKFSLGSPGPDFVGYQKLNEDGTITTADTSAASASAYDSSIGSNNTNLLLRKGRAGGSTSWTGHSFFRPRQRRRVANNDALAQALTDGAHPTEPLGAFDAWAVDPGRLSMGEAFAQGAFGRLYRGSYEGLDVAVKLLERPDHGEDPEKGKFMEQQFSQEVYMLATLDHPNIVRFVGACRKATVCCIVTEYAKGGSVRQFLATKREGKGMGNRIAVKQALDVARGMAYVHGLGFIHRDLKSDNLLIAGDRDIKIADFGVARIEVKTEGMTPETGTYRWMAPEMIQHRPYDHKVDVYSFGIVLWELITGTLPFQNMTAVQAAFAVVNKGARPPIPSDCHPLLAELMTSCWDTNPDVRPSFNNVVKYLEHVQTVIGTKARFRCCMAGSKTKD